MMRIGIFEAKTRLSEICERVAASGESVVITRRGRPLVRIDPLPEERFSVWDERAEYIAREGEPEEDFEIPTRSTETPRSPLDD